MNRSFARIWKYRPEYVHILQNVTMIYFQINRLPVYQLPSITRLIITVQRYTVQR